MNSTLLALLLLVAPQEDDSKRTRGTVLGLPGIQETAPAAPVEPAPAPTPAPAPAPPPKHDTFMPPRQKRTVEDYKALLEHNVFSPPRKKETPPVKAGGDGPPAPPAPKTRKWVMTGIVFNAQDKRYEALVEPDDAPKDSKFLKVGDTVAGVTVTEITFDQVTYKRGDSPAVLKMKDSLSETVAGTGAPEATKTELPSDADKIRERMKNRNKRESAPDEAEEDAGAQKKPK